MNSDVKIELKEIWDDISQRDPAQPKFERKFNENEQGIECRLGNQTVVTITSNGQECHFSYFVYGVGPKLETWTVPNDYVAGAFIQALKCSLNDITDNQDALTISKVF